MKRKVVSMMCVMALAASMLTGCGGRNEGGGTPKETENQGQKEKPDDGQDLSGSASDLDYVEIDWYIDLEEMPDAEMVYEKLNEYFIEKINTRVNFHCWKGGDYKEKVPTMLSSGQDMGIVTFAGTNLPYLPNVAQGAFYPMDELLEEYGTGIKGLFTDDEWNTMMVDGHIYGFPIRKDTGYIIDILYNSELADELELDMEALPYTNWRQNEQFWIDAKAKRDELHPEWADYPLLGDISIAFPYYFTVERLLDDKLAVCNLEGVNDLAGYDVDTVVNLYETEEYREYALMRQRLMAAGVIAYDYEDWEDIIYDGEYMLADVGWGYTYIDEHMWNDKVTTRMKMSDTVWADTSCYTAKGSAISANCANPERAMMVLELANTDPYVATMLRFGIEGEHYVYNDEGQMTLQGSPRNGNPPDYGYRYWYGPSFGNLLIVEAPVELGGPNNELLNGILECNSKTLLSSHMGFVVDTTNIINELAACDNVIAEFEDNIDYGRFDSQEDVEQALDEFIAKLKANNVDKIVEEIQSQLDAWNAAQ